MLPCGEFSSGRAQDSVRGGVAGSCPWIAPAFLLCAAVLLVWAAVLIFTLPHNYTTNHWRVAWGGFDIGLGTAMMATAIAIIRRSPFSPKWPPPSPGRC